MWSKFLLLFVIAMFLGRLLAGSHPSLDDEFLHDIWIPRRWPSTPDESHILALSQWDDEFALQHSQLTELPGDAKKKAWLATCSSGRSGETKCGVRSFVCASTELHEMHCGRCTCVQRTACSTEESEATQRDAVAAERIDEGADDVMGAVWQELACGRRRLLQVA